ncbi:putative secreted protein (Por secretion system target) [Neolewinella xylanilytica]|uniref:Putative secreted protein (Por secretion system target) n=1 Tax=Neolewinella xylanilytica TaxID=1514080 RepID=A0A2S6I6A4_9BACT|nr:T9SS type A sorting domain-containing protein [Neolewinella xylanilytica]PPK86641.1 putative secreted protein (Por secretion system target) [Neolewinella xylanilytica]
MAVVNNAALSDCTQLPCNVTVRGALVNTLNPAVAIYGNMGNCEDKVALRNDPTIQDRACIIQAIALPIELLTFDGTLRDDHVALSWETANETDNSHFFIERSINGFTFTAIGREEGAGTTTEMRYYTYYDSDFSTGKNYYRLRQVDFDGTEALSDVIVIDAGTATEGLKLFPNPIAAGAEASLQLGEDWGREGISLELFAANGQRVVQLRYAHADRLGLPTADLTPGIYLARISNGRRSVTERLVVR